MSDFIKKENEIKDEIKDLKNEEVEEHICVISITNSHPYDISEMKNNATTFYTSINYTQLKELYNVIRYNTTNNNVTYDIIKKYITEKSAKVFFDFKCSGDCHSGTKFVDNDTTLLVFKVVNTMSRLGCNIVVGDHSMAALFNNWDNYRMDCKSPITISIETTDGLYKMNGCKSDFVASDYPILKNLGKMSAQDNVEIEFENMNGTKIYKINEDSEMKDKVKIISKGYSIQRRSRIREIKKEENTKEDKDKQIVHSEFPYRNGKIIISATHWCNLTEVNSDVNIDEVRKQYTAQFGAEECMNFEVQYCAALSSNNKEEAKRVVSNSVKYMCSGKKDF